MKKHPPNPRPKSRGGIVRVGNPNAPRDAKGHFLKTGKPPKGRSYDDNKESDRRRGYLPDKSGRKIALYSRSPKGIQVRDARSFRLARRLIALFPFLERPDFYLVKSFA